MKTPRIEDFDPTTAPRLGSPMDDLPAIAPARGVDPAVAPVSQAIADDAPVGFAPADRRSADQPPTAAPAPLAEQFAPPVTRSAPSLAPSVRPYARTLTRMPFEVFQDQHDTLRQFSLDEKLRGEKGSMSQMVREALDLYIAGTAHADD